MLHAFHYRDARRRAKYHVQVEVLAVQPPVHTPGKMRVKAQVARVFHGRKELNEGDCLSFSVDVLRQGDSEARIPVGGTIWTDYDELRAARFMEVFMNGEPPNCEVALWQSQILTAPTDRPQMKGR